MNSLPLSWIVNSGANQSVSDLEVESASTLWIALADLKSDGKLDDFISGVLTKKKNVVIRGIPYEQKKYFCRKGFELVPNGVEALLDFTFDHFEKKSLRELIRRGKRHGKVKEIEYSYDNAKLLQDFKKESTHGKEPELLYLFQNEFKDAERLFVFENGKGEWLGGLLVSRNYEKKIHLELLLRQRNAPVGVMEALIYGTFQALKETGARYFSLGEVPFVFFERYKILSKAKLISFGGKMIRFAYNYNGLYHFKNKFNPIWKVVYLGGYPKVKFRHLRLLFTKSRLQDLALYKLKSQIF
ncbi:MAG: DUF2156 domain-containing protein [Chlorobi bacterium]|nr:DUF2156 domain-containing protein [Chlorobiota bacterium]